MVDIFRITPWIENKKEERCSYINLKNLFEDGKGVWQNKAGEWRHVYNAMVLFAMESNTLKVHRNFPTSNSRKMREAIALVLYESGSARIVKAGNLGGRADIGSVERLL